MKIAAIDLDGTLLRSDSTLSDYSRHMIAEAAAHDILVVPTSGRSYRSILAQVGDVPGIPYAIGGNGTVVTELGTEDILYEKKMNQNTAYEIYRYITDRGGFIDVYCGNDSFIETGADQIMYATNIPDSLCEDLLSTDIRILSMDQVIRRGTLPVDKIFLSFIDPDDIAACVEWLGRFDDIVYGYSTKYKVEIFPKGANKDIALDFLREKLGVDKKDVIAIGDSENDLQLIRYAHTGIAVDNGMDILKKNADLICPSNDEDGPAHILEDLIKSMG